MTPRTIITILLLLLIIAFPYWMYIPAVVIATLYFPFYYESILFGFLIDSLYGVRVYSDLSFIFPFAIGFSLLVLFLLPLRQYLRVQNV